MVDQSKHEDSCGCGGKTRATQQEKLDVTIDQAAAKPHRSACCGGRARQVQSDNSGCCGGSQSKQPNAEPEFAGCCGGNSHD
jgi:hypothetical protein